MISTRMARHRLVWVLLAGLVVSVPAANAKTKHPKAAPGQPTDAIEVVGHVPLTNGSVTHFVSTQHYSSYYLYAEHNAGKEITLIDVTKTTQPYILADVPSVGAGGSEGLVAVAGTAALVSTDQSVVGQATIPQTLRIMDFSDPQHPRVAREFTGVTAIGRDPTRGLVFVANRDGIWILQQHFAVDPQVEEEYAREVLYNR